MIKLRIGLLIVLSALLVLALMSCEGEDSKTKLQIGEVYCLDYTIGRHTDNPFQEIEIWEVKILDIKNNYILFKHIPDGFKHSRHIDSFKRSLIECNELNIIDN